MTKPNHKTNPDEYRAWSGMKTRCNNPKFKDWNLYGGKGIKVCRRWQFFINFFHDMGPKPSKRHSLDRIDSDGDYTPSNCRWATAQEQARNWSSRNRRVKFRGENLLLVEWAERIGISRESLRDRFNNGWSVEKALTTPPIQNRKRNSNGTFKAVGY